MTTAKARGIGALVAVLVATSVMALVPTTPAGALPVLPNPNSHGITVTNWSSVAFDDRLGDAVMHTDAIYVGNGPKDVRVRIYLPASYDPNRPAPYDVLYLLHGGGGDFASWTDQNEGDLRDELALQSDFQGIVVMPEAGVAGFYSDWYGETNGGFHPDWERFHVQQLVPWVDDNFNTSGTGAGRVIAGLSMGGYGALRYAARFPNLFSAVGSFSGGADITNPGAEEIINGAMAWPAGAAMLSNGLFDTNYAVDDPDGNTEACNQLAYRNEVLFGPEATRGAINPRDLASADEYDVYSGDMAVYTGDGGNPTYTFPTTPGCSHGDQGEALIGQMNRDLHAALGSAGVTHRWCQKAGGTHTWSYWRADLRNFLDYTYGDASSPCP